jgi:hypothetical protein
MACSALRLAMFSSPIPRRRKRRRWRRRPEQDAPAGEFDAGLLAGHDHPAAVGIVAAECGPIDHDGVHRPGDASPLVQLFQKRDHRSLVRHGDVETTELKGGRTLKLRRQIVGIDVQADVDEVQAVGGEGGVVHRGAQAVADGVPDQGQQPCLSADQPSKPPLGTPSDSDASTRRRDARSPAPPRSGTFTPHGQTGQRLPDERA